MANIGLNTIFPSARFLSTDASGDVQEVTAQGGSNASATLQGIKVDAVALEQAGNGITFAIAESNGVEDSISATNQTVTLSLKDVATNYQLGTAYTVDAVEAIEGVDPVDAVSSTATLDGIDIVAVAEGTSGDGITFEITEENEGDSISAVDSTVTLALNKVASDYKLNEYSIDVSGTTGHTSIPEGAFIYFIADDTLTIRNESIGSNEEVSFTAGSSYEVVAKDGSGRPIIEIDGTQYAFLVSNFKTTWGERLDSIATILGTAQTDVTDLVSLSISGADSDNLSGVGNVQTANGADAIAGVDAVAGVDAINNPSIQSILDLADVDVTNLVTLSITGDAEDFLTGAGSVITEGAVDTIEPTLLPNTKYMLIAQNDIFDLEEVEESDGRKVFFGLLETASRNLESSTVKSNNLLINRGNLILLSETKLRRSYNITATLDILDSDLSDES
jgi:hypothetical protein